MCVSCLNGKMSLVAILMVEYKRLVVMHKSSVDVRTKHICDKI